MRHSTWEYLIWWVDEMARRHGGTVFDISGKTWDWGQALVRDVYGPHWMSDEQFKSDDEIPPSMPAPDAMIEAAGRWLAGTWPDWAVIP